MMSEATLQDSRPLRCKTREEPLGSPWHLFLQSSVFRLPHFCLLPRYGNVTIPSHKPTIPEALNHRNELALQIL